MTATATTNNLRSTFSNAAFVVKNDPVLSKNVTENVIPQVELLFKNNNIQQATEIVHEYERKLRLTEDTKTLSNLFEIFVAGLVHRKCYTLALNELVYFGKKKHILESSLRTLVSCIYSQIEMLKGTPEFEELLLTFTDITEGKIYAEVHQAKAVLELVHIWEGKGETRQALDLILKSHVETYAHLEFSAKTEFILEQMRLCLVCREFTRLELVAKKISQKFLKGSENERFLMMYHDYMIKYHIEVGKYFESAKSFELLLKCTAVKENADQKNKMLKLFTTVLVLSEFNKEMLELMNELKSSDDIIFLPNYLDLLKAFTGNEIIQLSKFNALFKQQIFMSHDEPFVELFSTKKLPCVMLLLDQRMNERNLVIMSEVFCSITLQRVAEILEITPNVAEDLLVDMIADNKISGLINRMGEINIVFKQESEFSNLESLDTWSKGLDRMMKLVESTSYMISNEEMIRAAT